MENKETCKWCDHCLIIDLEDNWGNCDLDIGENVKLDDVSCFAYMYDDDLDRC